MDSYRSVHGKRRNGKIILISFINNYGFFIKKKKKKKEMKLKKSISVCYCITMSVFIHLDIYIEVTPFNFDYFFRLCTC